VTADIAAYFCVSQASSVLELTSRRPRDPTTFGAGSNVFDRIGMAAFAKSAANELLAAGERARKPGVETTNRLTAQELPIARMARDGLSNPEIGARLFISPRTVKYHLQKVFTKLDISSRGQLDRALARTPSDAPTV
jgi:DNA-binding NarL/FixJ family response regulator